MTMPFNEKEFARRPRASKYALEFDTKSSYIPSWLSNTNAISALGVISLLPNIEIRHEIYLYMLYTYVHTYILDTYVPTYVHT